MSHSTNMGSGAQSEQRAGQPDRRVSGERRNQERLKYMKGECRCNAPRRQLDTGGRMIEGELWWSGN